MPRHWKSFVARCAIRGLMYGLLGGCFFNLAWIPPGPEYFDAMAVGGVACVTSIVLFLLSLTDTASSTASRSAPVSILTTGFL